MAKILLAEDTPQVARLVVYKLTQKGHEVRVATDGLQAIQEALAYRPDLCILDVMMPGVDGYQVLYQLRADPNLASVPVILLTTLGDEGHVIRGLQAGANDYVTKPFSPSVLLARVERLLHART